MGPLVTRGLRPADVETLVALLDRVEVFRADEVEVGREVLEAAAAKGDASGYHCSVAEAEGAVVGFCCYGATPCTLGTFDLYWIAVDPGFQGRGAAVRLLAEAEAGALARGGRQLIAETSDTPPYRPARDFYDAKGFRLAGRIPDFYRVGDAKMIYVKPLSHAPS